MQARIVKMNRSYAFARNHEGLDIFVHFADCRFKLADCIVGDVVEISRTSESANGTRALVEDWETEGVTFVRRPS